MIIDKVGLEVEGGWNGTRFVPPFEDLDLIDDHSIDGTTLPTDNRLVNPHVGEAVSQPMAPEAAAAWIRKYWPHSTNRTCGYHIHVSTVDPLYYMMLFKKSFAFRLLDEMGKLGRLLKLPPEHYLWQRLSGENPFCGLHFDAAGQMNLKAKRVGLRLRYGFLNFAANIHGTMEFRALPTFDNVDHAVIFTNEFFRIVETYVEQALEKNHRRSFSLTDEDGLIKSNRKRG